MRHYDFDNEAIIWSDEEAVIDGNYGPDGTDAPDEERICAQRMGTIDGKLIRAVYLPNELGQKTIQEWDDSYRIVDDWNPLFDWDRPDYIEYYM